MKIELEDVEFAMRENGADPALVTSTLKQLKEAAEEEAEMRKKEKEDDGTPEKPYPLAVITVPANTPGLATFINDFPIYFLEIAGSVAHSDVPDLFTRAVRQHNDAEREKPRSKRAKRKYRPIEEVGDAIERLPRKYLKELGIKARHKVMVIPVNLPNALVNVVTADAPILPS